MYGICCVSVFLGATPVRLGCRNRHGMPGNAGRRTATFILPQTRAFYIFRQLARDMLSSQTSRSGHLCTGNAYVENHLSERTQTSLLITEDKEV